MAHPLKHAENSARKFGGKAEDYLPIHNWFDESKAFFPDFRHRALRHHAEGIFLAEKLFGVAIVNSDGTQDSCSVSGRAACPGRSRSHSHSPGLAVADYVLSDGCTAKHWRKKNQPKRREYERPEWPCTECDRTDPAARDDCDGKFRGSLPSRSKNWSRRWKCRSIPRRSNGG